MSDPEVAQWKQDGRVYLWRYRGNPRSYPGWHLTADGRGSDSLLRLFDLMLSATYSSHQTMQITAPGEQQLAVPGCSAAVLPAVSLTLRYPKSSVPDGEWSLRDESGEIHLTVGWLRLEQLQKGVEDLRNGEGDYAIAIEKSEEECLWVWQC